MTLQQEAEKYANILNVSGRTDNIHNATRDYIAGATSKFINCKLIEAQLIAIRRARSTSIDAVEEKLLQQLKQAENEL